MMEISTTLKLCDLSIYCGKMEIQENKIKSKYEVRVVII